jgi:hypothetical protein
MKDLPAIKKLREQSRCVQEEHPELFAFLKQRDRAIAQLMYENLQAIPNPDTLPVIHIPFIEAVIEAFLPQHQCRVCDDEAYLWLLSPQKRQWLCHLCKHGVFLRNTGIASLSY